MPFTQSPTMLRAMRFALLFFLIPLPALAGVGVMSPYTPKEGQQILETDGFYTWEDGANRLRARGTYDIGVHDRIMLRYRPVFQDNSQDRFHYDNSEFGARFSFAEPGELPLDLGVYTGLVIDEEDRDRTIFSLRLLAGKRFGDWQHHGEILISPSFQDQLSDAPLEFRFRTRYRFTPQWHAGAELFHEMGRISQHESFGQTNQRAGPFVGYQTQDRKYYSEFTLLSGLNARTDDAMFKWRIGTRF